MRAILMFHGVDDSGSVLSVTRRALESLVGSVLASGHDVVSLSTLLAGTARDAVALTFDDAFRSVHDAGFPVLRSFGVTATVFVTTGFLGGDNRWPSQPADAPTNALMGFHELETLGSAGWDLQAHSVSHPDLRRTSDAELERELAEPKELLARRLGIAIDTLAYPYGYYDARVAKAAAKHYAKAVTTEFRPLDSDEDALRLPRLDAYYLRSPLVHGWFGNGSGFTRWLDIRRTLRRLRRHPGEIAA